MKYVRLWLFRYQIWRYHQRIAKALGIRRFRGFTDAEIDHLIKESRRMRDRS